MQVLLDDAPCDVTAETVGEAIAAGAEMAEGHGRLITDVIVDGSRWSDEQLTSRKGETAVADVVRLVTADPNELVDETLADATEALSEADELQRQAAELLQSGQQVVAMDKLQEAISIWLSVQKAIVGGSRLIGLRLDEVVVNGAPIDQSISRLNERLLTIRSALEDRDQIGLADTLLYEFPEVVAEWQEILEHLRRRVQGSIIE